MIEKLVLPTPFAVGDVNAYVLKGDALTLIDVGPKTDVALEALRVQLKALGYSLRDIEQVVLTHHHPDHAGWVEAFENAVLLGHPYNDPLLQRTPHFMTDYDAFYDNHIRLAGVPLDPEIVIREMHKSLRFLGERSLDHLLQEGDPLPGHPHWTVLETLGHAQSHLAFWNEQAGQLIGGDLLLQHVSSNPLVEPPLQEHMERPKALLQYNQSLTRLLELPIERMFTGHGSIIEEVHPLIHTRLEEQRQRAHYVLTMMKEGEKSLFQLTQQLFPKVYQKQLGLTLSETLGQLDYLIEHDLVVTSERDGVLYYACS